MLIFPPLALMMIQVETDKSFVLATINSEDTGTGENPFWIRAPAVKNSGVNQADVFIDSSGKPHGCFNLAYSTFTESDSQTCMAVAYRILSKHMTFNAARGRDGKPMNGMLRFLNKWPSDEMASLNTAPPDVVVTVKKLPNDSRSAVVEVRYLVDEKGKIEDCAVEHSSGIASLDAVACRAMPEGFTFPPARDNAGKAWPVVRSQHIGFAVGDPPVTPATKP